MANARRRSPPPKVASLLKLLPHDFSGRAKRLSRSRPFPLRTSPSPRISHPLQNLPSLDSHCSSTILSSHATMISDLLQGGFASPSSSNVQIDDRAAREPLQDLSRTNLRREANPAQGEGILSPSTACHPSTAQIVDRREEENCKRKLAWELACAMAYAYLHQQPSQRRLLTEECHAEEENCRNMLHVMTSSSSASSACPVPACEEYNTIAEIVNPTQAAEWLKDRSWCPTAWVS